MTESADSLVAELESHPALQQRIDRVAQDLLSGDRLFAVIEPKRLGELLGVEFGSGEEWGIERGWALRKNLPGVDFSPEAKRDFKWTEKRNHYSWYEAQTEEALFTPDTGIQEIIGWCSMFLMQKSVTSSGGYHFSFGQISDGIHYEAISPYIDGISVDESDLFELRFVLAGELLNSQEPNATYIPELDCDDSEFWEAQLTEYSEEQVEQNRMLLQAGIIPETGPYR